MDIDLRKQVPDIAELAGRLNEARWKVFEGENADTSTAWNAVYGLALIVQAQQRQITDLERRLNEQEGGK